MPKRLSAAAGGADVSRACVGAMAGGRVAVAGLAVSGSGVTVGGAGVRDAGASVTVGGRVAVTGAGVAVAGAMARTVGVAVAAGLAPFGQKTSSSATSSSAPPMAANGHGQRCAAGERFTAGLAGGAHGPACPELLEEAVPPLAGGGRALARAWRSSAAVCQR